MSKQPSKTEHAKPKAIYYKHARLKPQFSTQLGNTAGGTLNGSTVAEPTRYTIRWVPGLPLVFVQWFSQTDGIVEYDIPLGEFESLKRISRDDEHAPLE